LDTIAAEAIQGDWGNGEERRERLEQAGYDYDVVQERVNKLME
jgi:cell division protein